MTHLRQLTVALAVALVSVGCSNLPPLHPFENAEFETPERDFALILGARNFESREDFGETDRQATGGIELSWSAPDEPLAFELAVQHSRDKDSLKPTGQRKSEVYDLQLGLRWRFARRGVFNPYLGGGLAVLHGSTKASGFGFPDEDESGWDTGAYLHAGLWAPFSDDVRVGIDVRWLPEEWLGKGDLELDHTQLGITLSTGF